MKIYIYILFAWYLRSSINHNGLEFYRPNDPIGIRKRGMSWTEKKSRRLRIYKTRQTQAKSRKQVAMNELLSETSQIVFPNQNSPHGYNHRPPRHLHHCHASISLHTLWCSRWMGQRRQAPNSGDRFYPQQELVTFALQDRPRGWTVALSVHAGLLCRFVNWARS